MPSELRPARLRRILALSTAEGLTATILVNILGGTFLTALALSLGASAWEIGLLAALGPAMQMTQVFLAWWVERTPSLRRTATWTLVLHRLIWSGAGLLALVLPAGWNLPAYMVLYALAFLLAAPGINAWQALMTIVVPADVRGRYFGRRWTINTGISMVILMGAGRLVDLYPGRTGFAILYATGLVTAVINWYLLTTLPELPAPAPTGTSYWAHLAKPLQNRPFRAVMLWLALWTMVLMALPPFFTVLMVKRLSLSYSLISLLTAVTSLASAASFPLWGRLIDRLGPYRLVAPAAAIGALVPLLWLPVFHVPLWYLFPLHVGIGLINAALQTLTLQLNFLLAPPNDRAIHLAAINAANGLAGFAGPILAGALAEAGRFDWLFTSASMLGLALAATWRFRIQPRA